MDLKLTKAAKELQYVKKLVELIKYDIEASATFASKEDTDNEQ